MTADGSRKWLRLLLWCFGETKLGKLTCASQCGATDEQQSAEEEFSSRQRLGDGEERRQYGTAMSWDKFAILYFINLLTRQKNSPICAPIDRAAWPDAHFNPPAAKYGRLTTETGLQMPLAAEAGVAIVNPLLRPIPIIQA
jgi:hypothetical protein